MGAITVFGCGKNVTSDPDIETLRTQLYDIQATLAEIKKSLAETNVAQNPPPTEALVASQEDAQAEAVPIEIHSLAEAQAAIEELGENPSAQDLATKLFEIDLWIVSPDEENEFRNFKNTIVAKLQTIVAGEVAELQKKALQADNGAEAADLYKEAEIILTLFPLSEDAGALDKARQLGSKQSHVADRLQAIRRQRYNHWATGKIENAINGYNENSSLWSPVAENKRLVDSCVKELAEIDPMILEPAVLDLYSYILNLTTQAISDKDRVALSKGLSDPTVKRKTLGDF